MDFITAETGWTTDKVCLTPQHNQSSVLSFSGQRWIIKLSQSSSSSKTQISLVKLADTSINIELEFEISSLSGGHIRQRYALAFPGGRVQHIMYEIFGGVEDSYKIEFTMKKRVLFPRSLINSSKLTHHVLPRGVVMPEIKLVFNGYSGMEMDAFLTCSCFACEKKQGVGGVDVYSIIFQTNRGPIKFNVLANPGQYSYILRGQCAMLMYDIDNPQNSVENIHIWRHNLKRYCGNIPIVVLANNGIVGRQCPSNASQYFARTSKLNFYDISARTNYNVEKPFLWLARKLMGENELTFVE